MYKQIGHVIKPHGLKGEVVAIIEASAAERIQILDRVFLDIQGSKIPYPLQYTKPLRPGQFKLRLDGVESLEEAEALRKNAIYCLSSEIPDEEEVDLEGFMVLNRGVEIGEVNSVIDNSLQVLLEVKSESGDVYIPLTSDWIIEVNVEEKKLDFDLPEGLLDI